MKGFKEFLMRGNVVDLAIAVVIGAAFTKIVDAFVTGIINPVIGLFGTKNLDSYSTCIKACNPDGSGGVELHWGKVVAAAIVFVLTAAVVYFGLVLPMAHVNKVRKQRLGIVDQPNPPTEVEVLEEIRDLLRAESPGASSGGATGVTGPPHP